MAMSDSNVVTVVAARFDGLMGRGLAAVLQREPCVRVLASDLVGAELEQAIECLHPKVVILDEEVDHAFLVGIRSRHPATGVVVLAHNPTRLSGTSLLAAGATCVARTATSADILAGVRRAAQSEPTFFGTDGNRVAWSGAIPAGVLTRREAEVFALLSRGKPYAEIAHRMQIGYETVVTHTRSICKKASVKSRLDLIGMTLEAEPNGETH
jgi:DNA-binding NarL/FixJ family response regulator